MLKIKRVIAFVVIAISLSAAFAQERPTFALVLSGGGARGIAHLAVIEELERRGIVPDYVIGTSIGALVGGFYSAGYTSSEIATLLDETDIMDLMIQFNNKGGSNLATSPNSELEDNILSLNFSSHGVGLNSGLLDDQDLSAFFRRSLIKVLPIDDFDELSIPFRAIGIDAVSGEEIVFEDGSLFVAMRASMSLPIIFSPVETEDGRYIMDGGMANNLPVDVARDLGADYVLAVDVNDAFNYNETEANEKMQTFSGAFNAFTTIITITNTIPKYEMADWVLVPDVNDYSTIGFDSKQEILEKGRLNVRQNISVFDEIEEALASREEKEFLLYRERPAYTISGIDSSGLLKYKDDLNKFIGRSLDSFTMLEFEELLDKISGYEGLKDLSYKIEGTTIKLKPSYYSASTGVATVGLNGELGVIYSGFKTPYFSFTPALSIGTGLHLDEESNVTLGIILDNNLSLETLYSKQIFEAGFFYAGLNLKYLNLAYNTDGRVYGNSSKNDFGSYIAAGIFYSPENNMQVDLSVGFDYSHLARVLNHKDFNAEDYESATDLFHIHAKLIFDYKNSGYSELFENGLVLNSTLSIGLDIAPNGEESLAGRPSLAYAFDFNLEYVFGIDNFMNVLSFEADSIRRYPKSKSAYMVTKTGVQTPDYIYAYMGVRGAINKNAYFEAGPFVEFYKSYPDKYSLYYLERISKTPFSSLDSFSIGLSGEVGISSEFGRLYAAAYFSFYETFATSIMIGIR